MDSGRNPTRYRLWAPIYDVLISRSSIRKSRRREMQMADFRPGQKVLIVGVGTGEDLPFLPDDVIVVGIDITPEMIRRTVGKARPMSTNFVLMDAETLAFADATFDIVIMNLILTVTEHPRTAMAEAVRVMRKGGKMLIFDKFMAPDEAHPELLRTLDRVANIIATSLVVRFEDLIEGQLVTVVRNVPSDFISRFRIILITKDL
jgi:phosphatidylethanolamine/phosphatidyl-N-methylethanolamine N-methyltransferase